MAITVIYQPRVSVVARPAFDEPDHLEVDWIGEASDGERLAEYAGRLCYMSQANPSGRSTEAYLENIRSQRHGCYDGETDVLTEDGWKPWSEVTMSDRFATRTEAGTLEYHHPVCLIRYHHRGRMYRVESQQVDLLVTPDHKMLVCPTTTRQGRARKSFMLIPAETLGLRSHAYIKTASWISGDDSTPEDVLALLGFTIGDGSTRDGSKVEFNLRRTRKRTWLDERLGKLGWAHGTYKQKQYVIVPPEHQELFRACYDENREKQIPPGLLTRCSSAGLRALYEGLLESDGHRGRTGDSFDTTSPTLPGQIQQLCLHLGLAANVCYTYEGARRKGSFGQKPLTRMSIVTRSLTPEVNRVKTARARSYWVENWEGDVYCAEVPNHTVYVRRNGRPVWSGNSVFEHANYSLLLEGVSRSLTHELIRHRAGFAYSQLSQRYVDESDAAFVCPPAYIGTAMEPDWRMKMRVARDAYEQLVERSLPWYAGLPKRDARIKAREAARSVLPNATETKVVVTGNTRAWRTMLELRGSEAAEREIRRLAVVVARVLRAEAPGFFADVEEYVAPDGHAALRVQHSKI